MCGGEEEWLIVNGKWLIVNSGEGCWFWGSWEQDGVEIFTTNMPPIYVVLSKDNQDYICSSIATTLIRVLLFEDNEDFIDSMGELIRETPDIELLSVFRNAKDAVRHIAYYNPDIVVMDIDMPVQNGLEGLRAIRHANEEVIVIMLTVFDDNERVFQAVCNGASGYLLKSTAPEKILEGIREAKLGGAPMTPSVARQVLRLFSTPFQKSEELQTLTAREHEVLSLLVRGYSYKMAAGELAISIETLRFHIKNIYSKLHVNSKSEAVAKAIHNKLNH